MRDTSGRSDKSGEARKRRNGKAFQRNSGVDAPVLPLLPVLAFSLFLCSSAIAGNSPHLLVTPDIIRDAKAKVATQAWAKAALQTLTAEADKRASSPVNPPTTGGGWAHNYVCPKDASFLKYDENSPNKHLCPRCNAYYGNPPMNTAWVGMTHQTYARAAETCGLAFQLTGKRQYADWARRVLLWYAERYADFPVHGRWAGRGKVGGQSLDESVWLVHMLDAFDVVNETLTDADRATIANKLAIPAATHIEKYSGGVNNIECWHATARLLAAVMADRQDVRDSAVASLRKNIDQGITEDGFWFEGSIVYHEYVLTALSPALLAARHNSIDLGRPEKLLAMYAAPSKLVLADLELPSLNDGWAGYRLEGMAPLLETACGLFKDAQLVRQLAAIYAEGGTRRTSPAALLYGPARLPADAGLEPESHGLSKIGLVAMRQGGNTVILKAGARHGGHDHCDRLNLILADRERTWFADLGTPGYGHPLTTRWYKHTAGHCTVVVDNKPQASNVTGRIEQFEDKPDCKLATVACDDAYPGVKMRRTVAMIDGLILDRFEVSAGEEHDYAFMLHAPGRLTFEGATPDSKGTTIELGPVAFKTAGKDRDIVRARWTAVPSTQAAAQSSGPGASEPRTRPAGAGALRVIARANRPFLAYTADVPGIPGGEDLAALAIQARSREVTFAVVYASETGTSEQPAAVAFERDDVIRVTAEAGKTYEIGRANGRTTIVRR